VTTCRWSGAGGRRQHRSLPDHRAVMRRLWRAARAARGAAPHVNRFGSASAPARHSARRSQPSQTGTTAATVSGRSSPLTGARAWSTRLGDRCTGGPTWTTSGPRSVRARGWTDWHGRMCRRRGRDAPLGRSWARPLRMLRLVLTARPAADMCITIVCGCRGCEL
jgi:hypothetical protein